MTHTEKDDLHLEAAARITALECELEEAREALKPMADEAVRLECWAMMWNVGDELKIGNHISLTMADLRRAARAYANKEELT